MSEAQPCTLCHLENKASDGPLKCRVKATQTGVDVEAGMTCRMYVEMRQLETYEETAVRPQMSVGVEQRRLQTSGTAETAVHPQLSVGVEQRRMQTSGTVETAVHPQMNVGVNIRKCT